MIVGSLLLVGCGGASDTRATGDAGKLDALRSDAASPYPGFGQEKADQVEALVTKALDIAVRNRGKPIGAEAFAFAQQEYLRGADDGTIGHLFTKSAPALPACDAAERSGRGVGLSPADLDRLRGDLGFLAVVPAPYKATDVAVKVHGALLNDLDSYLGELDTRVAARARWVSDLLSKGSTKATWYDVVGQGGPRCLREVAVKAKAGTALVAAWDSVAAAAVVADSFDPAPVRGEDRNGVFVTTYTRNTVATAQRHLTKLGPVVAAVRRARDRASAR